MTINDLANIIAICASIGAVIVAALSLRNSASIGRSSTSIGEAMVENADAKLRLDLFEKRLEVYEAIDGVFVYFFRNREIEDCAFRRLHWARERCRFLFDDSLAEYINELIKIASGLSGLSAESYALEKKKELGERFDKEYHDFTGKFVEYMRIVPVKQRKNDETQ